MRHLLLKFGVNKLNKVPLWQLDAKYIDQWKSIMQAEHKENESS